MAASPKTTSMASVFAALLGFAIAFVGSIPIAGPLAVLILDKALAGRKQEGLFLALGGALVEALVALAVAMFLPNLLGHSDVVLIVSRGLGGLIIGACGVGLIVHPRLLERASMPSKRGHFLAGVTLTALNPTLVATWTIIIGALHTEGLLGRNSSAPYFFALGVYAGVLGWFTLLLQFTPLAKSFFGESRRLAMMRILGAGLVCVSAYLMIRFVVAVERRYDVVRGGVVGHVFKALPSLRESFPAAADSPVRVHGEELSLLPIGCATYSARTAMYRP